MAATIDDAAQTSSGSDVDWVIVGAGFAGMYLVYMARKHGFTFRAFEAGSDVGGTWYWNRYPGARCDVESLQYCFTFSDEIDAEWTWSERYAAGPEIQAYQNFVATRLDLRRHITFNTRVTTARFDEKNDRWLVTTDTGESVRCRFLIMATGALSIARRPDFPGASSFEGQIYHPGAWPHEKIDLGGKRVGVVGTGSSGVQLVPEIAKKAAHLHVFQRTPCYSIPAQNRSLSDTDRATFHENRKEFRRRAREDMRNATLYDVGQTSALAATEDERRQQFETRWRHGGGAFMYAYNDLVLNEEANRIAADFVRAKIRETVKDPHTADLLSPKDYPIGTKRICIDTDYFETFNRPNVSLVDVNSAPILSFTETGLRTAKAEYDLDIVILATGYDAITGAVVRIDIRGVEKASLAERWRQAPLSYLGLTTSGFPNLFTITGPGSPSVLSNVVVSIEQHVEFVTQMLLRARNEDITRIEADVEAEAAWTKHCHELASRTLHGKSRSWYQGDNVPGKTRVFMPYIGGTNVYRKHCDEIAARGYEGFRLTKARAAAHV